jgi:LDH2 family malate/lactate/ureidoglycolate dehydrogenase
MTTDGRRRVKIDDVRTLMERFLAACGCDPDVAEVVADVFLEADLRGHHVQGLDHLIYMMVRALQSGRINPNGRPRVVKSSDAFALVDGDRGPGQVAGVYAADLVLEKTRHSGVAAVGVVNSSDIYLLGYYAERMARGGIVGMVFSDGLPLVHAPGGAERILGTNPLAFGIPAAGKEPIVLDCATSAGLYAQIHRAAREGRPIPEGVAVDADGVPTRDPRAAIGGALSPLGSPLSAHKGYGLALCVGLLSGPLVGATVGPATGRSIISTSVLPSGERRSDLWENLGKEDFGPTGSKGHLFLGIDPAVFGDPERFRNGVTDYVNEIKNSRKAPGSAEILVPGERSLSARERCLRDGLLAIEERAWADCARLAARLNVNMPPTSA